MKKPIILLCCLILNFQFCAGQQSELSKKVVILINEARTTPLVFYNKYKDKIVVYNPAYAVKLPLMKAITPVIYDVGLEAMGIALLDSNNLNPSYKGLNKFCGQSSGYSSSIEDPLSYVCDMYTNVHDEEYKYFGIYFSPQSKGSAFNWGIICDRRLIPFSFLDKVDTSKVDFSRLNTGKDVPYLSSYEKRMLLEINFVRVYPKIYVQLIALYLNESSVDWGGIQKDTYEAWLELKEELDKQPSLTPLLPDECLFNVAKSHGQDCQNRGFFDHIGSDGKWPHERILNRCPKFVSGSENGVGGVQNERESVIALLLDNGISSRGHRYNILDPNWRYCSCYRWVDKIYGYHWVQKFAY